MIGCQAFIKRTYRHEKMTKDKKNDDVYGLEDDAELSLEFTFDWNIRMEGFP